MSSFYSFSPEVKKAINDLIDQGNLSTVDGPEMSEFETNFSQLFGHNLGVATCNGTSAIHLAYFMIDIRKGDQVIIPSYGFHAMATTLLQLGGIPIFCDIDRELLTIEPKEISDKITPKTKAIMVLQTWGNVANVDEIITLSKKHNLVLISDSSHAHGAKWRDKPLGSYFDIVCASLGKGKLITGGELGVVTTNNTEFRDRALLFSHPNRVPSAYIRKKYSHLRNSIALKYRPNSLSLKLALDQLDSFGERNSFLVQRAWKLVTRIQQIECIYVQKVHPHASRDFWKIVLISSKEIIRLILKSASMKKIEIEISHYSPPLHLDSIYTNYYNLNPPNLANAEYLQGRICQIDAIQLYNQERLEVYLEFFDHIENEIKENKTLKAFKYL